MNEYILTNTYRSQFVITHEGKQWTCGICLANPLVYELNKLSENILHKNELLYLNTLTHEKRIRSYLLGRYSAKQAIEIASTPYSFVTLSIEPGIFYQPVVYDKEQRNLQVSISHTNELGAAIAFPEAIPMAIDTEFICESNLDVFKSQMKERELDLPDLFPMPSFNLTVLWTLKEALSKVLRCGLLIPFELLEVKSMFHCGNIVESNFVNFPHFKAHSFFTSNNIVCSIVFPSKLNLDIFDIFVKKLT